MFKFIKKIFGKRGQCDTHIRDSKSSNKKKGELKSMPDELKNVGETKPTEEVQKEVETKNVESEVENGEKEPKVKEKPTNEATETQTPTVEETAEQGNGMSIDDLVTKADLDERLSAINSKIDAFFNETKGLLEKANAEKDKAKEETAGLKSKYEEGDFGNQLRKGTPEKDKSANDSYDEYCKQFK